MAIDIEVTEHNGDMHVKVGGEVDLYSSPDLRSAITKSLPKASNGITIILTDVTYMDSSGVATLVEGLRGARDMNKQFTLAAPSQPVRKVLELSRLDSVFSIQDAP